MLKSRFQIASLLIALIFLSGLLCIGLSSERSASASSMLQNNNRGVRSVTIPVTVRPRGSRGQREVQIVDLAVREDGEPQRILSVRDLSTSPISVAVLVQDDVVPSVANEIKPLGEFIRRLPPGSRVLVGYIRGGAVQVRQKFTTDLERAASTLRIPTSSSTVAPYSLYSEVVDVLKKFEALPAGRRAMLVVSDGLDSRGGIDFSSVQSVDLQRAVREAQKRSVAIYSFYAPTVTATVIGNQFLIANAQGALRILSSDTGGQSFFQGTSAPVSFEPFLRELNSALLRQVAVTYLSTHTNKGFHRIEINSQNEDLEVRHPAGYRR